MNGCALYAGRVRHTRLRPVRHPLDYRIFWLLLDLDEIDRLSLRLLKRDAPGVFSFVSADHLACDGVPLRAQVEAHLAHAGVELDGGRIELMCMPRVLGYVFNPISVYFCRRRDGELAAMLYEVNNTFGERHIYVIPVEPGTEAPIRQSAAKRFHVSPFMDMDLDYDFRVAPPDDKVLVAVNVRDEAGLMLTTSFAGRRRPLTDANLARALLSYPLMTVKVMAAIHFEALKLWLKGVKLRTKPEPVEPALTLGRTGAAGERGSWRPRQDSNLRHSA